MIEKNALTFLGGQKVSVSLHVAHVSSLHSSPKAHMEVAGFPSDLTTDAAHRCSPRERKRSSVKPAEPSSLGFVCGAPGEEV